MNKNDTFLIHSVPGMLRAGFEPARLASDDLKSPPLDHSGISAITGFWEGGAWLQTER